MKINLEAQVKDLQDQVQELKDLVYAMAAVSGSGLSIHTEVHEGELVGRLSDFLKVITMPDGSTKLALKVYADELGPKRYLGDDMTEDGTYVVDETGKFGPLLVYVDAMSTGVYAGVAGWPH